MPKGLQSDESGGLVLTSDPDAKPEGLLKLPDPVAPPTEELEAADPRSLYQQQIKASQEKGALETLGDFPEALAGALVGGVGGLAGGAGALAGGFVGGVGEESYANTLRRMEDGVKERMGRAAYENTLSDLGDIAQAPVIILSALWDKAGSERPYEGGKELGEALGEDAIGGIRWTFENAGTSFKAFPLATLMMATGAAKSLSGAGRSISSVARGRYAKQIDKALDAVEPVIAPVRSLMETEVPGTIVTGKKKLVTEGGYVPGTLYTRAIGDEGIKLKDLASPAVGGAATGLLVGAPELGALLMLGGKVASGVLAKRNSKMSRDVVGGLVRMFRHTSAQARVSDEVATRALFDNAPQAQASLQAATTMLSDAIRSGVDLNAPVLDKISTDSGIRNLVDIGVGYSRDGDRFGVLEPRPNSPAYVGRHRKLAHLKLDKKLVDQLDKVESTLKELGGKSGNELAAQTRLMLDDLLSGESTQYARDVGVMTRVVDKIKELDPDIPLKALREVEKLAAKVARGPIFGLRSVNPFIRLSDGSTVDFRSLATDAWKGMGAKQRMNVLARVSSAILEENKGIVRGVASAKALDMESRRIFKGDAGVMKRFYDLVDSDNVFERKEALDLYTDKLLDSAFLHGDALPMVSPRGISFSEVGNSIISRFLNTGKDADFRSYLDSRLGRAVDDAEFAGARNRLDDIADALKDPKGTSEDLGAMGSELSRQVVADGLEPARITEQLKALRDEGLITDADFATIMKEGLTDAFDIAVGTAKDKRSIRAPLAQTYWWLQSTITNNPVLAFSQRVNSWVKASYTTLNPASHVNNAVSNIGLLTLDRGLEPTVIIAGAIMKKRRYDAWKSGDKVSRREARIFDQVKKMGFAEGDIITAEIKALATAGRDAGYGMAPSVATSLNRASNVAVKSASALRRKAGEAYRLGDTVFKFDEAIATMDRVFDLLDDLQEGQYLDVETSPATVSRITRRDGELHVAGNRTADQAVAAHARMKANELFFDYSQRPGLLRMADHLGGAGSFLNPYLTWYWKAMGIGGKGLLNRVTRFAPEYASNSPKAVWAIARRDMYKQARRALVINAMRSEFNKHPEALADVMKFVPSQARQVLFMDLADPNVMKYRDISSMDFFSPVGDAFNFIGSAVEKLKGSERGKFLEAIGKINLGRTAVDLTGIGGSPLSDVFGRIAKNKEVSVEDMITIIGGAGIAQAASIASRAFGGKDLGAFDRIRQLPENVRNTGSEYYFRRLTSVGWDKRHLFGKRGHQPGKITRYFAALKSRLKRGLVEPVIREYKEDIREGRDVLSSLAMANEMYLRRVKEVQDAYRIVYPDYLFPEVLAKPIKIRKSDLQ